MPQEPERFRRDLAGVLDRWVSEDLVSADQATRLRDYYRLGELDAQASSRFVATILVFGGILVGLGVISFVAANWEMIPPAVRVFCCTALLIGSDWWGWRLWLGPPDPRLRQGPSHKDYQRWGDVLLLIGTFLLGADIALTAQWFNVGGDGGGLFLGWGLGALALAWGIRHAGVGAVGAVVLFGATLLEGAVPWLPWLYALAVVPLALTTGSRVLLTLGLLGALGALGRIMLDTGPGPFTIAMLAGALGGLGAAGLAATAPAWREALAQTRGDHEAQGPGLTAIGERLANLVIGVALVGWSFRTFWDQRLYGNADDLSALAYASGVAFGLAALALAAFAFQRRPLLRPVLAATGVASAALAGLLLIGGSVRLEQLAFPENLVLAGFALYAAWTGLERADRNAFWFGLGLLSIQVFSRFLEFESGLLLKSLAFISWGVGLIVVGLWFERSMAQRRAGPVTRQEAA